MSTLKDDTMRNGLTKATLTKMLKEVDKDNVVFLCIGTDRCTGDSLGPIIGTMLSRIEGINVFGTLDDPCHATTLPNFISLVEGKFVIAIDACLGKSEEISNIYLKKGHLKPGTAVGKSLPSVGNLSITGVVNVCGNDVPQEMLHRVLSSTRLSLIMKMATDITKAIASTMKGRKVKEKDYHLLNVSGGKK